MKLMWFHLMPYTELPDDFRDKNPSVWVDIHSSLFDPKRAHLMYNDFMDELEFAADCGFDAICLNDEHGDLRDGQLDRAVQSADPGGGRVRDDRRDLRRSADRGFSCGNADGRLLLLRSEPVDAAR